jgi:hypothetical protein
VSRPCETAKGTMPALRNQSYRCTVPRAVPRTPRYGLPAVIAWRPSLIGYRLSAIGYRLSPLASRLSPLAPLLPLPVRAQRRGAPTRGRPTFNVQRSTFNPSRLSPLAPPRPTACRGRWHGTAPQDPHTAAIPPASGCAAGGDRLQRSGPPGATTRPAPCHPHSR